MKPSDFVKILKGLFDGLKEGIKERSIEHIEDELKDLEGAFGMLLFGSLLGLPLFPSFVGISLLPYAEREIITMLSRSRFFDDFASFWFHMADI